MVQPFEYQTPQLFGIWLNPVFGCLVFKCLPYVILPGSLIHHDGVGHEMQKRVPVPFGPRHKLRRKRVQHIRLFQLNPIKHRTQGRPGNPKEWMVCVTDFHESFPKFSAFSDRAQSNWIADDCHERLCARNRSVQQFRVWQKAEIEVSEVLL